MFQAEISGDVVLESLSTFAVGLLSSTVESSGSAVLSSLGMMARAQGWPKQAKMLVGSALPCCGLGAFVIGPLSGRPESPSGTRVAGVAWGG